MGFMGSMRPIGQLTTHLMPIFHIVSLILLYFSYLQAALLPPTSKLETWSGGLDGWLPGWLGGWLAGCLQKDSFTILSWTLHNLCQP